MKNSTLRFAPRDVFGQLLEYAVIPTFDLIISFNQRGIVLVRRKIAPYKNTWALPGLRMMKPEGIGDTLKRIAIVEIGVRIEPDRRDFVGQYVGRFKTEHQRQDLSTCYALNCDAKDITLNNDHFTGFRFINEKREIPRKTGAMYKYYLELYFNRKNQSAL